ncbi:MAG: hypothetical protein KKD44_01195 [Proteobacteria bacterium]|nr:hypothetical protein [Pseudomonadota bacterium]
MIHPLYFPYTGISDQERDVILAWFGQVSVYQPMAGSVPIPQGLNMIVPVSGDEARLTSFLAEYRQFASLNRDKVSAFIKGTDKKPFYDPTWASEIRSEIIKHVEDDMSSDLGHDMESHRLLWARAVLQIAHDYDQQNQEIDSELEHMALREKKLFDSLMGGDDETITDFLAPKTLTGGKNPETRIELRLAAWATLFLAAWPDALKTGEGFYLTSSREVVDHLCEYVKPFDKVCDMGLHDIARGELGKGIHDLVKSEFAPGDMGLFKTMSGGNTGKGCLSLYIAPDQPPCSFFGRFLGKGQIRREKRLGIRNTVIGFVEI